MAITLVNQRRKGWIDALRGLAMFLVVFGHALDVNPKPDYFLFTSPLRMPLFFAISAYLLNDTKTLKQFLINLARGFIVPWMILGMVRVVIMIPFKGGSYLWEGFLRLLTGEDLWFMPCYLIAVILHFIIRKYLKKEVWITLASFVAFLLGLVLHQKGFLGKTMINQALTVQPFFLIGYLFRSKESFFLLMRWSSIALAGTLYLALYVLATRIFPSTLIDIHLIQYYNIPLCLFLSFLGVWTLFSATAKADFKSWTLSFIGQNTLVIYIWSGGAITILFKLFSLIGWNLPINGWTALLLTVCTCLLCGISSVLLTNYVPWAVGRRK